MKLVFFQLDQLEKYQNIKIKYYSPKVQSKVIDLEDQKTYPGNFSIFRHLQSKNIYLYYSSNPRNPYLSKTCLQFSSDGLTFQPTELEMDEKGFSSNLLVWIDPSAPAKDRYKALGGCHLSQWHAQELSPSDDLKIVRESPVINLKPLLNLKDSQKIYDLPHPAFIKRKRLKSRKQNYSDDQESMFEFFDPTQTDRQYYHNGLYLFTSDDGHQWHLKYNYPIISGMHQGHYDYLYFCSTFRSQPNCFYDPFQKKYFLYLRSHLIGGLKHLQVTKSDNLTSWDPLDFVNFKPTFDIQNDNYEALNPLVYPETKFPLYLAFPVYNRKRAKTKEESSIKLAYSLDALNWKIGIELIKPALTKDQCSSALVNGLILSNDGQEFYLYEHRNRFKTLKGESNSIWRYSIRIDGFSSISAGTQVGFFQTHEINFLNLIKLNYRTRSGGYLHLEYLNSEGEVLGHKKNIKGDSVDYSIDIPSILKKKKGFIRITLKEADLFAIEI